MSPKWSALWKMTIRHKNGLEMQCFSNQCKSLSVIEKIRHVTTKNTYRSRRSAVSVHSTDAFRHATELVGTEIWSFCQHAQFYFAERREWSWFSCWKNHNENAEENSTAYERLSRAVYRFSARLRISTYQLYAGMIFTMLFLHEDKKFSQKVL